MPATEPVGKLLGALLAPVTGAVALIRKARMFHPDGRVFRAEVVPLQTGGATDAVARRLAGPALVRMSSAWWRGAKEWTDVLGCAVRFRRSAVVSADAADGDQDLLFATIRSPWTTLPAALTTRVHDFLANDYYAVSPFAVDGLGKGKWRLVSSGEGRREGDRSQRLLEDVSAGTAELRLEFRRLGLRSPWVPVCVVRLLEPVTLDQAALRFSPFRCGRGIEPRGLVHALRHATYSASQGLRPRHGQPA